MTRVPFPDLPWTDGATGARSKALVAGGTRLRLLELRPEFEEPGWCTSGHHGYVLEGELQLTFAGGAPPLVVRAGDGLTLEPGAEHAHRARALTPRVLLFLVEAVA